MEAYARPSYVDYMEGEEHMYLQESVNAYGNHLEQCMSKPQGNSSTPNSA